MSAPDEEGSVSDFGVTQASSATALSAAHDRHPDPRYELAAVLRRITAAIVGADVSDAEIASATIAAGAVASTLEAAAGPTRRLRGQPDAAGHPQDFFPSSPASGFANPVAPPITLEAVDGELRGSAYFDYQYEGPPTCVHGGVIAMVFDEILAATLIIGGTPGMTGTMTVRYRRPTPLRTPLRLEARFTGREGRKIMSWGGIFHGELLTAEAEGIFIELPAKEFMKRVAQSAGTPEMVEQVRADVTRLGLTDALPSAESEPAGTADPAGPAEPAPGA